MYEYQKELTMNILKTIILLSIIAIGGIGCSGSTPSTQLTDQRIDEKTKNIQFHNEWIQNNPVIPINCINCHALRNIEGSTNGIDNKEIYVLIPQKQQYTCIKCHIEYQKL
jgi:nitrate/TMAO reductase-like tetraheme cytochrome c subunit